MEHRRCWLSCRLCRPLPYPLTLSCISPRRSCQTTTSDRTGCRALGVGWRKSVDLQTIALWCGLYVDRYFASIICQGNNQRLIDVEELNRHAIVKNVSMEYGTARHLTSLERRSSAPEKTMLPTQKNACPVSCLAMFLPPPTNCATVGPTKGTSGSFARSSTHRGRAASWLIREARYVRSSRGGCIIPAKGKAEMESSNAGGGA